MAHTTQQTITDAQANIRFTIKKGLTEKLNMEGWVIYRDPENGLYAYNPYIDGYDEVFLNFWNQSLNDPHLNRFLIIARGMIADFMKEEHGIDIDLDAPLILKENW